MIKKITTGFLFLIGVMSFSQVGIGTDNPQATLDVTGKSTEKTSLDGIIAPRMTGIQLRAKTYTTNQIGALVYVTEGDTAPNGQTINVTEKGYFYFDGTKWVRLNAGTAGQEPWFNQATNTPATGNTQDIYQSGKVSIGKNATGGQLSIYDTSGTMNGSPIYTEYISNTDSSKKPWFALKSNLGYGSWSSLTIEGDQAFVFSVDASPNAFSRNALEFIPHSAAGGATPFGFKVTDQGMFSFNAQYPTETLDLATGTMRIRNLPLNGAINAIYTTPTGGSSVAATTDLAGLAKTQTFTATRTVIADKNGVLGYVTGLPVTKNADGIVIIENLPVYSNNNDAAALPAGALYRSNNGALMVKY